MAERTGTVPFTYSQETFHTWYKVVGDIASGARPLVTLHGGPGISHHYMLPHAVLAHSHSTPVVFYDQIGIGESSHPANKPPGFWSMDLFINELDNLLVHLGIRDDFDLIGHSWGAMLAVHYASNRHPKGMKHLVIADGTSSMELWAKGTDKLREQLPTDVQAALKKHEAAKTTNSQEYHDAVMVFYKKHICSMDPWPKLLLQSFAAMEKDPTVYTTMIGPSDIHITGTLRKWSCVDQLENIPCPTLLINSELDEAQDVNYIPIFTKVNKVKWIQLAHSTHLAFFEDPERYFSIIRNFLEKDCQ
ncbi:proline-specific peptidase [Daedalea quercina L-15889]|uniref:Proline-specific peptidase n=1 Tax=Daedalea quercina L-15889 TaxID=1314783 RepID=A0A165PRR2_9APHY|nr:proline-specific peptidase [Daedalea quercina L-15889]